LLALLKEFTVPDIQIRRLQSVSEQEIKGLSDVLVDCVTGGASVGYMWQLCGQIPKYALMPDGAFCATPVFYQLLK
jgi:hypothetical protein